MKITKLRFIGFFTVDLPIIGASPSDRYVTKSVDGLGPTEVDVSIADTLFQGGVFQGSRPHNRELVAKIGLSPNYFAGETAEDLRDELYGMMTPGASGSVTVQAMFGDTVVGVVNGYIKKIEPALFSKEAEVQLTFSCLSPYWRAQDYDFLTSLDKASPQILNKGTAEVGLRLEIALTANKSSFSIAKHPNGERMDISWPFLSGDHIVIDTRPGLRTIQLIRAGNTYSLMHALAPTSTWLSLYRGNNNFYTSHTDYNWVEVYYRPEFLGV